RGPRHKTRVIQIDLRKPRPHARPGHATTRIGLVQCAMERAYEMFAVRSKERAGNPVELDLLMRAAIEIRAHDAAMTNRKGFAGPPVVLDREAPPRTAVDEFGERSGRPCVKSHARSSPTE